MVKIKRNYNIIKKISKRILAFTLAICFVSNVYAANIIYAPTQAVETIDVTTIDSSDDLVSPESEVISMLSEDATMANHDVVFNIVEENNNYYCYDNGVMVKNAWRKISKDSFAQVASVDNFQDPYIWAYFQSSGRAIKGSSNNVKKVKIDGSTYAFNEYGQLLKSYFNELGEMWNEVTDEDPFNLYDGNNLYHADESTGALTSGWYKFKGTTEKYPNKSSIWMYFSPSTFRAVRSTSNNYKKLTVDGKTYAFDDNGVMLVGFEAAQYNSDHGGNTTNVPYFASDGAEVKSGFVEVDMEDELNYEIYGDVDEDITIYLSKSGKAYYNTIKKIGSNYYGFTEVGAVVKGLSVWEGTKFISYIQSEDTNGKKFIVDGTYVDKEGTTHTLSSGQTVHYFDSQGKRVTNSAKIEFSDETYTYKASNSGANEGMENKKYYVHGLLLKPMNDSKYGVIVVNPTKTTYSKAEICGNSSVYVVNSSGTIQSSNNSGLKDDNDNYWLLSGTQLVNIYSVNVKKNNGAYSFKGTNTSGNDAWISFGTKDSSGNTCVTDVLTNGTKVSSGAVSNYQVNLQSDHALNFYLS